MAIKRFRASTLVEFVLAFAIIGICFSVATFVFVQANRSTIQFKEVMEQTEFQSILFEAFVRDTLPVSKKWEGELTEIEEIVSVINKNKKFQLNLKSANKTLWSQEFYSVNK